MYLAERLGKYCRELPFQEIPPAALRDAKHRILDTLAVALAGAGTEWARTVLEYAAFQGGGRPEATALLGREKIGAEAAALANGTMAHSLDYDDDLAGCHIGCVVVPAALAMAEKTGSSGAETMAAVIVGYDVTVAVSQALNSRIMYQRGFHPTSLCGVFGAAAAAARLLGLSAGQAAMALSIAGSFASGSMEYLADGAWTKRLQPGKAAMDGLMAALLAQRGYIGPRTVFEGENGILHAYTGEVLREEAGKNLGREFEVSNAITKYYPACSCNAAPIEAAAKIVARHRLPPGEIKAIRVKTTEVCIGLIGEPIEKKRRPETVLEAQMSLPYCLAAAILDGEFTLRQIAPKRIRDRQILDLAGRIEVAADPGFDISVHPRPQPAIVSLETTDGRVFTERVDFPKGNSRNPLTAGELLEKLRVCAGNLMGEKTIALLAEAVLELEKAPQISSLMGLMGAKGQA